MQFDLSAVSLVVVEMEAADYSICSGKTLLTRLITAALRGTTYGGQSGVLETRYT